MAVEGTTQISISLSYSSNSKLSAVFVDGVKCTPVHPKPILSEEQWKALTKAEAPLYAGNYGCHAYTDVMSRDQSEDLVGMWDQAQIALEGTSENWDRFPIYTRRLTVASRVAKTLAVLSFGAEFLLR